MTTRGARQSACPWAVPAHAAAAILDARTDEKGETEVIALRGCSFRVAPGEIVALVGETPGNAGRRKHCYAAQDGRPQPPLLMKRSLEGYFPQF